jgi:hypothetical protein
MKADLFFGCDAASIDFEKLLYLHIQGPRRFLEILDYPKRRQLFTNRHAVRLISEYLNLLLHLL